MIQITVITSVLNGMPYLDRMLELLPAAQSVEHIAIDAGSTDGSGARLRQTAGLTLLERPGLSLYGAWNEGVAAARGRYIWFVNADDLLPPGAMARALAASAHHGDSDIIAGNAEAFADEACGQGRAIQHYCGPALAGGLPRFLAFGAPMINAKLIRRDLIMASGGFDTSYRFAADRAFLLHLVLNHKRAIWRDLNEALYRYRIHGNSMTLQPSASRRLEISAEHQRISERYLADLSASRATSDLMRAWLSHERAVSFCYGVITRSRSLALTSSLALARDLPVTVGALWSAFRIRNEYRRALRRASTTAEPIRFGGSG